MAKHVNIIRLFGKLSLFAATVLVVSTSHGASPAVTLQGRLTHADGSAITGLTKFRIQVLSPSQQCILFDETQEKDLSGSKGLFSVSMNDGSAGSVRNDSNAWSFEQALSNRGSFAVNATYCQSGSGTVNYTPAAADERKILVQFKDPTMTSYDSLPVSTLTHSASSIDSVYVGGFSASSLLRVENAGVAQTVNSITSTNYDELIKLALGTSNVYLKTNGVGFAPTSSVNFSGQSITNLAAPAAGTDAANKTYVDSFVGGKTLDSATISALASADAGKVLSWNGTTWTATSGSDTTKLPLAGGTMTGAIAMGLNNITNTGYITQGTGKYIQIGSYSDATEATMLATLTPAHQGVTWFNTTDHTVKYWTGTDAQAMGASFANQSANVVFAGPASGSTAGAPGFRALAEADVPTLAASGKVANSATTAASANTASAIVARDVSGGFSAGAVSSSSYILRDASTGTVTLKAPTSVTSYSLTFPSTVGSTNQMLTTDASGNLSWTTPTVAGTAALADGAIFIGNSSGKAAAVVPSGDATITNAGIITVSKIQNQSVSSTTPVAGQVLKFAGSAWTPSNFGIGDLKTSLGASQFSNASCGATQTLTWSSLTDAFACTSIQIAASQVTQGSQTAKTFFAAPAGADGLPSYRAIASTDLPSVLSDVASHGTSLTVPRVYGSASASGNIKIDGTSDATAGYVLLATNTGGKVGIGTSTPAYILDVSGDANFNTVRVGLGANGVSSNTVVGNAALNANTTGYQNTAIGFSSLKAVTTGNANTAVGYNSQLSNLTGGSNTSVGTEALKANTAGGRNAAFGVDALSKSTSSENTAVGQGALYSLTSGGKNTAVGRNAAGTVTGTSNTAIGTYALNETTTGSWNTALGASAGSSTGGSFSNGVFLGAGTGTSLTTGSNNILIGYNTGQNLTSGANNILIGASLAAPSATANNQLSIGGILYGDLSNGNIGIGVAVPTAKLQVAGPIVSTTSPVPTGTAVDLSKSNTFTLASVGGSAGSAVSVALTNLADGGNYTIVTTDTISHTYDFTGCTAKFWKPANAATTAATRTIYNVMTISSGVSTYDCYISWATGYQ